MPSNRNTHSDIYKSSQTTRGEEKTSTSKVVLGVREYNIIRYALLCNEFRLCELVEYYHRGAKGRERLRLFNMYYCALLRLQKRGYVIKVGRGCYRLVRAPTSVRVIDTRNGIGRRKFGGEEKLSVCGGCVGMDRGRGRSGIIDNGFGGSWFGVFNGVLGFGVLNDGGGRRRFRLRFHCNVRAMGCDRLVRVLYLRLLFVYRFSGLLLKEFSRFLSRRERRVLGRLVSVMLGEVVCNRVSARVGVHRLWFGRRSVCARGDGLLPVSFLVGLPVRVSEVGFDVVFDSVLDFRELLGFSKFYVEDLGRVDRVEEPLSVNIGVGSGGGSYG